MFPKDSDLTDLISLEDWQGIQHSLSEVLDIAVNTFSPNGTMLTSAGCDGRLRIQNLSRICKDKDFVSCVKFLFDVEIENLGDIKEVVNLKGAFGLEIFFVPIRAVGDKIIAYLTLGPLILNKRKSASEYAREAEKLGIDPEEAENDLIEINVFSYNKVSAIIKLVKEIFSHIAKTAYHKRRLAEITPEVVQLDPSFSRYYEERILNSLLNCCTLALNADSGSIMTLDHKTHMLHVKVASKLDEEMVNNSEVKLGEGIAGMAAATAQPIMLPKDENKAGLSEMMKRRYIKSSMVVPFQKKNAAEVYGVINLNMVRKEKEFSERDISLVKELVNMASIALFPVKEA